MSAILSGSEAETIALGRDLAARLTSGAIVLVEGPLGAGKTAFIRGLAEGLGCDPGEVSSPTFTLLQHYAGRVPVYHADLYRLAPAEVADLGLDDVAADGVLAVEWPDRWTVPPAGVVRVGIVPLGPELREIRVET